MRSVRSYEVEVGFNVKGNVRVEPYSAGVFLSAPAADEGYIRMTADQAFDLARALQQAAKDHNDISNVEDDGA